MQEFDFDAVKHHTAAFSTRNKIIFSVLKVRNVDRKTSSNKLIIIILFVSRNDDACLQTADAV